MAYCWSVSGLSLGITIHCEASSWELFNTDLFLFSLSHWFIPGFSPTNDKVIHCREITLKLRSLLLFLQPSFLSHRNLWHDSVVSQRSQQGISNLSYITIAMSRMAFSTERFIYSILFGLSIICITYFISRCHCSIPVSFLYWNTPRIDLEYYKSRIHLICLPIYSSSNLDFPA